ncbi:MAG: alpha/beta hydrolase-fold protein [Haliscomenobacter sp.]
MHESYHTLYSQDLGRHIEYLVFGDWGYPVIVFPTSMGRYYEAKDFGLVESVRHFIESGKIKLYCIDSIDTDSWYAKHLHPAQRVYHHTLYDRMLNEAFVPMIQQTCHVEKVGVAGCSFGGYHALNFAFRHPEQVAYLFSMGGAFDIKQHLNGYYDDQVYFHCPPDFLPDAWNPHFQHLKIALGTATDDFCKGETEWMSHLLHTKGIAHWLDIRPQANHDWPIWRKMFPDYLAQIG